jgi:ribokinase
MILIAGSANLDFVVRAHHIPAPGETVLGQSFQTFPGGKGANQAVACARAGGATTHFVTGLGADAFALPLEASLKNAGVQLHAVRPEGQPTGTAFICVSDAGENAITVAPGANGSLRPAHLPALEGFSHLLMQLEIPLETVQAYAQAAHDASLCVVLNAAPARALPRSLLDVVDVLIVNEGELAALTGPSGDLAQRMAMLALATLVVTLGARGCVARHHGVLYEQAAFAVDVVDSTGAGDTFCGALLAAWSAGADMAAALRRASAAAALACTRMGAQSSVPTVDEVDQFLESHPQP